MRGSIARKRVLIVDDEENISLVLAAGLARLNKYEVETAAGGIEALSKFRKKPFHLVVTDYRMPDMSGIQLSRAIRQLSPDVQIVLMTAFDAQEVRREAGDLQFSEYVQKPIPVAQIRNVVERALHQALSQREGDGSTVVADSAVQDQVRKLRLDTQADCALLLRSEGHLVVVDGVASGLDVHSIGALIAANFMAATELARLLGNASVFKSSFHEGPDHDIYAHDLNGDFLLAVIFGAGGKAGLVRHYTQETAVNLRPLLAKIMEKPHNFADDSPNTVEADLEELFGLNRRANEVISLDKAKALGIIAKNTQR